MSGSYAKLYRQAREALEGEAEQRLGRPLNDHEQNLFRNCGTLTKLEELGMTVYFAGDADELTSRLASMSLESRFLLAVDEFLPRLARLLKRPITSQERQQLCRLGNIEELWALEQHLSDLTLEQRAGAFADMLQPS